MKLNYVSILFFICAFTFAQPGSESAILAVDATIPYQGIGESAPLLGSGQYKIYYDNVDGVLDKPIFFVDGFDPNDSRDIPSMYSLLDFGNPVMNLGDLIRDEGYDLVVLNYEAIYLSPTDGTTPILGGADYIQRNAFTLVELINTINSIKVGAEENVVIGPSMGGLIARYALRYMEQNTMDHETRLFISFDSPHLGANVPIGIQYLFNYMLNGDPAITEAEPFVNGLLNSAAAKQMLIDHYLGHVDVGGIEQDGSTPTPKGAPNFRDAFQNELNTMGFPQNVRNVAITNGSGNGQMTGSPGLELINHTFDTGQVPFPPFGNIDTRAIISVHFTPSASQNIEVTDFVGQGLFGSWFDAFTFNANAQSTADSDGLDSAPGGQFDLYSFDDGTNANPLITEFVDNLNSQYFNFIPTLSGLAISTESDWYAIPNVGDSPFANTYIPTDNEPHVTLTQGNVAFALAEIFADPLGIQEMDVHQIKLAQNPVRDIITISSNHDMEHVAISVFDMTGKMVLNLEKSLSERTTIPINLDRGIYLVNIVDNNNSIFKTKLVVK